MKRVLLLAVLLAGCDVQFDAGEPSNQAKPFDLPEQPKPILQFNDPPKDGKVAR